MKKSAKLMIAMLLVVLLVVTLVACGETGGTPDTKYTISFDSNGGSAVADMVVDGKIEITVPTTTKEGYSFAGWYVDNGIFNERFDLAYITANPTKTAITVYAKWTINKYTVTFNSNGGSAVAPITQDYNTSVTKPTDPTKTGYTFEAWYKDSNFATAFNFATDLLTKDTTLYANWTINKYTVTFNSNGGGAVLPLTQDYNTLVAKPTDPTKTGYTFEAWYKESSLSIIFDFATDKLTKDTTLYANWTINKYTVTFDSNGGSAVAPITQDFNTLVSKPTNPTKTENVFGGWYKDSNFATAFNFATDKLTENTTIYAKWTINQYALTFNSNGGSAVADMVVDGKSEITLPTTTKEGYSFAGWYVDNGIFNERFDLAYITANPTKTAITVYAKWTANQYTITFNSNGGSAVLPLTQDYNTLVAKPTDPTKTGYTFEAWYKESSLSIIFDFATDKLTKDTTLYANWTINKYTVTFDSNGGSAVAPITQDFNTLVSKPTIPTKTENVFGGWYKDSNFATAFNFATDKLTKDTTLYAKWTINQYALTFNSNGGSAVAQIMQDYNTLVAKPTDPTKTGYTFEAWYKDSNFATAFNFATDMLTENTMLYANWTINRYTLTFNSNGGSAVAPITQDYNTLVAKPTNPINAGNVFDAWYKDSNFATAFNFATDKLTENTTIYAKWITVASADLFDFTFTDSTNTAYSIKKKADATLPNEIALPSSYNGAPVTSIAGYAFSGCSGSALIVIPNSVTSIGACAFKNCSGLTAMAIPVGVTNIGENAFEGCSKLISITIPATVKSIGKYAFSNCSNLLTINCEVASQPSGWDRYWSMNCPAQSVFGYNNITTDSNFDYILYGDDAYLTKYKGAETVVTIPSIIGGKAVVDFGTIFSGNKTITAITIGSSVKSIGNSAFSGCSELTSITVDKGNQNYVSYNGIVMNKAMTQIISVPKSIQGDIVLPNTLTNVGNSAFSLCSKVTSITIPASVTSIGQMAFYNCSGLTSITIEGGVKSIGDSAFSGCSGLTTITIPSTVTIIGNNAFQNCSGLTSIVIPNSVTSIGNFAFSGCGRLTSVTIGTSVASIGNMAFQNCTELTTIKIPVSVLTMGAQVFGGCTKLTTINCEAAGQPAGWSNGWKYNCSATDVWGYTGV